MNLNNLLKAPRLALYILIGGMALSAPVARAQVAFTITGTATNTDFGYILGNIDTFTYVTTPNLTYNDQDYFDGSNNNWLEYRLTSDSLFSSVTGDGLAGTYTRPTFDNTDPRSKLIIRQTATPGSEFLEIAAASQHSNLGLTMNGYDVNIVYFAWNPNDVSFYYPGVFADPGATLAPIFGTYFPGFGISSLTIFNTDNNRTISFGVSSVTIGAAIPEPSTYAALAGLGVLVLAVWRRRPASPTISVKKEPLRAPTHPTPSSR